MSSPPPRRAKTSRWDDRDADNRASGSAGSSRRHDDRYHNGADRRQGEQPHRERDGRDGPPSRYQRGGGRGGPADRSYAGSSRRSQSPPGPSRRHDDRARDYQSGSSSVARRPVHDVDFERDRRRERLAYDATATSRSGGAQPLDGPAAAPEANFAPDFGSSGLLAAASNNVDGIALKYHEPPEARKPKQGKGWRLYVFKDGKDVDLIHLTRQSCYLLGREKRVVDIPLEHPSASKQHAVIQFRQITERNEFGDETRAIRPFLIDLESANGSYLNGAEVPTSRFVELKSGDTLKFGASTREWVLLPEDAA